MGNNAADVADQDKRKLCKAVKSGGKAVKNDGGEEKYLTMKCRAGKHCTQQRKAQEFLVNKANNLDSRQEIFRMARLISNSYRDIVGKHCIINDHEKVMVDDIGIMNV